MPACASTIPGLPTPIPIKLSGTIVKFSNNCDTRLAISLIISNAGRSAFVGIDASASIFCCSSTIPAFRLVPPKSIPALYIYFYPSLRALAHVYFQACSFLFNSVHPVHPKVPQTLWKPYSFCFGCFLLHCLSPLDLPFVPKPSALEGFCRFLCIH